MGTDFTAPALDELFFPANSGNGSLLPVTFNITDDNIFEKDHAFTVAIISTEDNVNIEEPSNVTVIIEDDEGTKNNYYVFYVEGSKVSSWLLQYQSVCLQYSLCPSWRASILWVRRMVTSSSVCS